VLADGKNGFYHQSFDEVIAREGDVMQVLDVYARDVGIMGIFSRLTGDGDLLRQLHGTEISHIDIQSAANPRQYWLCGGWHRIVRIG